MSERKVSETRAQYKKPAPRRGSSEARAKELANMRALVRRRASALRELAKH